MVTAPIRKPAVTAIDPSAGLLANVSPAGRPAVAKAFYVQRMMGDLPQAYSDQMPDSIDPAELAAAEQKIRGQFVADGRHFVTQGGRGLTNVTATLPNGQEVPAMVRTEHLDAAGTGKAAAPAPDLSKLNGAQLLALGVKQRAAAEAAHPQTKPAVNATAPAKGSASHDPSKMNGAQLIALATRK
ncbi:MAG TPA: hypothetical protein VFC78_18315 [Tepidisphaeraceae bacterium]|nr:hypothetical protein [Tepidisphaeraceae bacterium]